MKLTETQRDVLLAAAEPTSGRIEICPAAVRGGARAKVLQGLVARGLATKLRTGHRLTSEGYAAIGHVAAGQDSPTIREGTKQAQVIAMLRRKDGATVAQIQAATGWLPHTVRGMLSAALRTKLGLDVTSAKSHAGDRVYRIEDAA